MNAPRVVPVAAPVRPAAAVVVPVARHFLVPTVAHDFFVPTATVRPKEALS
ncbi:hypothetical protein RN607_14665 [Demequina capsici]|uniref:Uncharacterized protein n=1 Tax=Demequina capsici TaxID=3075620 RepID=A0AA96JCY2_9MICO|nr:hypothetical protein [Demequina sp. PMTSA13]WNM27421.1 hypothetical protein RN607_14665 [Demequina sp. PMTSA13]